ncbi:MAG: hypothetical protein FWD47_10650 [Treponema sp.]|nr:hypothetical protein [Treponema sp.]
MKRTWLLLFLIFICFSTYAQTSTVVVVPFTATGGVTADEAQIVTELFIVELVSTGRVNVVDRASFDLIMAQMRFQDTDWASRERTAEFGKALNAQAIIRGQLMKMGERIYWTATVIDVNTHQILSSARDQVGSINQIFNRLPEFCQQIVSSLPQPPAPPVNHFVGRWQAGDGCILVIRADGTIIVERYRYQATYTRASEQWNNASYNYMGTGTITYNSNRIGIHLQLHDPIAGARTNFNYNGMYNFSEDNNRFTLIVEGRDGLFALHFNDVPNYYTTFTRIR